ncbi:hypothetical protein QFZ91_004011 [Paraburkholderia sp. JPY419]
MWKLQHVEFVRAAAHFFEQQHMRRHHVADRRVEAQRLRPESFELRRGLRITACKQRDVVALLDQRLGQIGHHAFRTTVQLGRNRLVQRSDLSDSHIDELLVKNQAKVLHLEKATRLLARAVWPEIPARA